MPYSTSQLMERLGVTREMLRYYESAGLVVPGREADNRYRVYTDRDGFEVLRVKLLQAYRLNLKKSAGEWEAATLAMQAKHLMDLESQIQAEIQQLQSHLGRIRKHRSFIEDAMHAEPVEMETYGIYKLMLIGHGVADARGMHNIAAQWLESMPVTEIGWSAPWPDSFANADRLLATQVGLKAMPHCVQDHALCVDPPVTFFPAGHSVRVMVRTEDPFHLRVGALEPLDRYVREHGYRVVSDVSGRYSGCAVEQGRRWLYFSARVLVEPGRDLP